MNKRKEEFDVYIGRGSKWGNPFTHIYPLPSTLARFHVETREQAILSYENYIRNGEGKWLLEFLPELIGKRLGCFCKPKSCHGDVFVKLINEIYGS